MISKHEYTLPEKLFDWPYYEVYQLERLLSLCDYWNIPVYQIRKRISERCDDGTNIYCWIHTALEELYDAVIEYIEDYLYYNWDEFDNPEELSSKIYRMKKHMEDFIDYSMFETYLKNCVINQTNFQAQI
ncbi:MAG: hypothetical protein D6834_00900 [Aquificota bacterium]|nr:MAG: hypothetical protein D6834_00900 [Aquificota bacterium]